MNTQTLILAKEVLLWWKDAQYWESYPGHNQFNEDPAFIKTAKAIFTDAGVPYVCPHCKVEYGGHHYDGCKLKGILA